MCGESDTGARGCQKEIVSFFRFPYLRFASEGIIGKMRQGRGGILVVAGGDVGDQSVAKFRIFQPVDRKGSVTPAEGTFVLSFGGWGFQESECGLVELPAERK